MEWRLAPNPGPLVPHYFWFDSSVKEVSSPSLVGGGDLSCGEGHLRCQSLPAFPKVFLFNPSWSKFLSHRPYVFDVFSPPSEEVDSSDALLQFQVIRGPLHSNSCFFVKGFSALQGYHVFGPHDPRSQGDQVPGLFRGRLRFRLEWRDWSSQGARLLDSLGFFTFHFCESLEGGGDRPPGSSGCPKDRTDSSFFHHFCSLVLFEEAGFLTLPPLPQGCRGFDFVLSPKSHFFGACPHPFQEECFCRPGVSGFSCFSWDRGPRLLRFHFPIDVVLPTDGPFSFRGHCYVSLLHNSLGKPKGFHLGSLGSFFQLESVPICWEVIGSRVRSSSVSCPLGAPAQKSAGPPWVPSNCVLGPPSQNPSGSPQPPVEVSGQDFSCQFPGPSSEPLFPFLSRVETWTRGLTSMGFHRDVALLATQSHKPSTTRQYQSGWKQFEGYLADNCHRHEDVSVAHVANFIGRQFLDNNFASSTVINHLYAVNKPCKAKFNLDLFAHDSINDLVSGMRRVRPGRRGDSVFPKWSLRGLLRFLNSDVFEPLERASLVLVRSKLLTLVCLATGRRVCEIAAIANVSFSREFAVFHWFPEFLAKMENDFGSWKSEAPRISPIVGDDVLLCPVRALHIYLDLLPAERDPKRFWLIRKSDISLLVRDNIKTSFRFAPRTHAGVSALNTKVSVHDLRKFACSYSRKYLVYPRAALAKRVGSKSFAVLDRCYIRDVPRVEETFQVPLGTIKPDSPVCHSLRVD